MPRPGGACTGGYIYNGQTGTVTFKPGKSAVFVNT
tara:strand:+ start:736 stop:840 length:105 start_codon:yes stop_codon:yes gene_type:complete